MGFPIIAALAISAAAGVASSYFGQQKEVGPASQPITGKDEYITTVKEALAQLDSFEAQISSMPSNAQDLARKGVAEHRAKLQERLTQGEAVVTPEEEYKEDYESLLDLYTGQVEDRKAAGQPFRELSEDMIPLMRADLTREPGTSPMFTRGVEKGGEALATVLSKHGLLDSGTMERATGEMVGGMMTEEFRDIRGGRERTLGYGMTGLPTPLTPPSPSRPYPQTPQAPQAPQYEAKNPLLSSIFGAVSNLPIQYAMGKSYGLWGKDNPAIPAASEYVSKFPGASGGYSKY